MEHKTLEINMDNILPIIKKSLYSDRDIFLRELVSNSMDAIAKLKMLQDRSLAQKDDLPFRVDIRIDSENKTIEISDNGIGMTQEEIKKYIAQLAFSGAQEFASRYEGGKEALIGHFGLGFYSCFMVSQKVTIDSLSHENGATAAFWSSDGSASYLLGQGHRKERGTTITLFINEDSFDLLESAAVQKILRKYCAYLPYPIYLNDVHENEKEPLWLKNPADLTEKEYIDFYHELYPMESDPIFWIHLSIDVPFSMHAILYFPKLNQRVDFSKNDLKLFCNRVFVSDQCKEIIPDYLSVLKGAMDSPDIPLNVSRSYLQMDRTVRQIGSHISKKIADKLLALFSSNREQFYTIWPQIELVIKLGALQDEKFYDKIYPLLLWKSSDGDWLSIDEFIAKGSKETLFYTQGEPAPSDPFLTLYKNQGLTVLVSNSPIDTPLFQKIEQKKSPWHFCRIDGSMATSIVDESRAKTTASEIAAFFTSALTDVTVEAQSLASEEVPSFVMIREQERRMREFLAMHKQEGLELPKSPQTLVVNTNNKLIEAIARLQEKNEPLAQEMAKQVYQLALLSQKELQANELPAFIQRTNKILEELALQNL